MRSLFFGLIVLALFASPCFAQVEAVKLLASQSDLVVIATFSKPGLAWGSGKTYYHEDFDVVTVLVGKPVSKSLSVEFIRPNDAPAPHSRLDRKSSCSSSTSLSRFLNGN